MLRGPTKYTCEVRLGVGMLGGYMTTPGPGPSMPGPGGIIISAGMCLAKGPLQPLVATIKAKNRTDNTVDFMVSPIAVARDACRIQYRRGPRAGDELIGIEKRTISRGRFSADWYDWRGPTEGPVLQLVGSLQRDSLVNPAIPTK